MGKGNDMDKVFSFIFFFFLTILYPIVKHDHKSIVAHVGWHAPKLVSCIPHMFSTWLLTSCVRLTGDRKLVDYFILIIWTFLDVLKSWFECS